MKEWASSQLHTHGRDNNKERELRNHCVMGIMPLFTLFVHKNNVGTVVLSRATAARV